MNFTFELILSETTSWDNSNLEWKECGQPARRPSRYWQSVRQSCRSSPPSFVSRLLSTYRTDDRQWNWSEFLILHNNLRVRVEADDTRTSRHQNAAYLSVSDHKVKGGEWNSVGGGGRGGCGSPKVLEYIQKSGPNRRQQALKITNQH